MRNECTRVRFARKCRPHWHHEAFANTLSSDFEADRNVRYRKDIIYKKDIIHSLRWCRYLLSRYFSLSHCPSHFQLVQFPYEINQIFFSIHMTKWEYRRNRKPSIGVFIRLKPSLPRDPPDADEIAIIDSASE